jgi:outer membrane lipoprotein
MLDTLLESERLKKIVILGVAMFLSVGCNTLMPEPIRTDAQINLVEFSQLNTQKGEYVKQQARWGGMIAKVTNLEKKSVLEIVHFDLSDGGKPKVRRESKGRFKVYVDGFVDPMIYQQGKLITALGHISDAESGQIGEYEYQFPTLMGANVYLWKKSRPVEVAFYQPWLTSYPMYRSPYHFPRTYFRGRRHNEPKKSVQHPKSQPNNDSTPNFLSRKK